MKFKQLFQGLLCALALSATMIATAADEFITVASTTSTENSGLFKFLLPKFTEKTGIPVYSVAGIKDVVQYLYEEKVPVLIRGSRESIDDKTKTLFDKYLKTYGN